MLLNLKSKQGDITAEFLHANWKEKEHVLVEMPLDFRKKGIVFKLKNLLYCLHQAPWAFWKYLIEKLFCRMPQSKLDPCLFTEEKIIFISYVDGLLF